MDNESGETIEEEVIVIGRCELESERLLWGWRREDGSWFQRRGEAYRKERSVIRREGDVDGRAVWPKMKSVWWRCGKVERMERHRCVPFQLIMYLICHWPMTTLWHFSSFCVLSVFDLWACTGQTNRCTAEMHTGTYGTFRLSVVGIVSLRSSSSQIMTISTRAFTSRSLRSRRVNAALHLVLYINYPVLFRLFRQLLLVCADYRATNKHHLE